MLKKLPLNDDEATYLLKLIKQIIKNYQIDLSSGNKGEITLKSEVNSVIRAYALHYYTPPNRSDKMSLHLRDKATNLNLARINIDPTGFHNNSDGTRISGNRLLLFSSKEWVEKNDGQTHVKAYTIPNDFSDLKNLEQVFLDFLVYINVKEEGKIQFSNRLI